jgi:hypothetical protein
MFIETYSPLHLIHRLGDELAVAVFTHMILLSVVSLTVLDYLSASAAGAGEHAFSFSNL